MGKMKEYMNSLSETIVMTRKDKVFFMVLAALAGCLVGMLISPRKTICCGNGNGTTNYYQPQEEEE